MAASPPRKEAVAKCRLAFATFPALQCGGRCPCSRQGPSPNRSQHCHFPVMPVPHLFDEMSNVGALLTWKLQDRALLGSTQSTWALASSMRAIGIILFNHSDVDFEVKPGERIAQLILKRITIPKVVEVLNLDSTRGDGGFGSTGKGEHGHEGTISHLKIEKH